MTRFRLKLAAILLSTGFNIWRGRPLFPSNDDDKPGSPNDVVEIENPEKQSTTSIRRKRDRDGDIISTQQTSSTQNHRDGDNFLGYISELYGNLPKKELTGILCDYIRSIDDAVALE
jgi:hypothetical protein